MKINSELKIVFAGPVGAGKTTAIAAVSETDPIRTDVAATDATAQMKATTTVGFDYGQLTLNQQQVLRLYGTPGQDRFDYLWEIICKGALGLVLLIDNSSEKPLDDLRYYLERFGSILSDTPTVIGITRFDLGTGPDINAYYELLGSHQCILPVMSADARRREDVLMLLDTLLVNIEAAQMGRQESELFDPDVEGLNAVGDLARRHV